MEITNLEVGPDGIIIRLFRHQDGECLGELNVSPSGALSWGTNRMHVKPLNRPAVIRRPVKIRAIGQYRLDHLAKPAMWRQNPMPPFISVTWWMARCARRPRSLRLRFPNRIVNSAGQEYEIPEMPPGED